MKIQILTTGGTIEGLEYANERNSKRGISIETFLSRLEITIPYTIEKVLDKDSRFVTNEDRKLLAIKIKDSKYDNVLITHGTISMVETAQYLGRLGLKKTIILTGAFILGAEPNTDAPFNLAFAINEFDIVKPGVYIAMNNRIFDWNNVRKNIKENRFESISKK